MASISTRYSYSDTFDDVTEHFDVNQSQTENSRPSTDNSLSARSTHSSTSPSYDNTRYTSHSSVSDTLTYRSEEESNQEGFTDVEDYSDTFESGFPTETVKTSIQDASISYLETIESSQSTEQDGYASKSYLETVTSSGASTRDAYGSKSYLESVASTADTSKQEENYLDDSFESASETGTSFDLHTYDMTESHIFGPATEEIRELTAEDLLKAEAFEAQENFLNHWFMRLRSQSKPGRVSKTAPARVKESKEQKTFCRRKIHQLREAKKSGQILPVVKKERRVKNKEPVEAYGVSSAVVDRLKLENIIKKMEHLSSEEIHEVHRCKTCRKQQKKLEEAEARKHFLDYHSRRLRSKEVDICVDNHLTRMTSINLIGEIVRDLPPATECSDELLYRYKQQIVKQIKDG